MRKKLREADSEEPRCGILNSCRNMLVGSSPSPLSCPGGSLSTTSKSAKALFRASVTGATLAQKASSSKAPGWRAVQLSTCNQCLSLAQSEESLQIEAKPRPFHTFPCLSVLRHFNQHIGKSLRRLPAGDRRVRPKAFFGLRVLSSSRR